MPLRRANTKDERVSLQSVVLEMHTDDCSDNYSGRIKCEYESLK